MTYSVDKEFILEAHKAACFDWKKKIEVKFPQLFSPHKLGKIYYNEHRGRVILAQVGVGMICLINLESGNRWKEPISVYDTSSITEEEFSHLSDNITWRIE